MLVGEDEEDYGFWSQFFECRTCLILVICVALLPVILLLSILTLPILIPLICIYHLCSNVLQQIRNSYSYNSFEIV